MRLCITCNIDEKTSMCCGSNPETGESIELITAEGNTVIACPNLSPEGECLVYGSQPQACKDYDCPRLYEIDLVDRFNLLK
ncbi:hypothetical protein D6745_03475 [Candidatus Woesearchaeota archaeon]|nr:MAG: hypothetical protein D6745_03475 [Candidatus Woesearchaeota archaeon]